MKMHTSHWCRASSGKLPCQVIWVFQVCLITIALLGFGGGMKSPVASASEVGLSADAPRGADKAGEGISAIPTLAGGELFALAVGVSRYADSRISTLKVAARDAQDFALFLEQQSDLFRNCRITLLTDEKATKKEVERALFYDLRKAGKDDTIFIFLSGHGAVDPKRPEQFLLPDARCGSGIYGAHCGKHVRAQFHTEA